MAEEENRVANYPRTGKKTLPVGTSIINWKEGKVFLADNTTEYTTKPLEGQLCQAFLVYFDAPVELGLYKETAESFYSSLFPTLYTQKKVYPFNTTRIKTDRETSFYIFAATNPEGIPDITLAEYITGDAYRRNETVTTGSATFATAYTNADEHDIYAYLSHIGSDGFILNKDSTATLYIWVTANGTDYYGSGTGEGVEIEYIPIPPSTQFSIYPLSVHSIKIGADSNNVSYTVVVI